MRSRRALESTESRRSRSAPRWLRALATLSAIAASMHCAYELSKRGYRHGDCPLLVDFY